MPGISGSRMPTQGGTGAVKFKVGSMCIILDMVYGYRTFEGIVVSTTWNDQNDGCVVQLKDRPTTDRIFVRYEYLVPVPSKATRNQVKALRSILR